MGGWSARKALKVIENVEYILAIELLASCQALDFIHDKSKLNSNEPLEAIHSLVRTYVDAYNMDRYMAPDIEKAVELVRNGQIWNTMEPFLTIQSCLRDK
jgi:histidine ammonia-lyase